jgi:hypothetical protein
MINAVQETWRQLDSGADANVAAEAAKKVGAFSGAMPPNLIQMMNHYGLNRWLVIKAAMNFS